VPVGVDHPGRDDVPGGVDHLGVHLAERVGHRDDHAVLDLCWRPLGMQPAQHRPAS
jgi:hypothetical protein